MPLVLEPFDRPAPAPEPAPTGPSPDWLDGHAAGFEEGLALGRAEAQADGAAVTRELAQSLQDLTFAYAEAREQVLVALRPLFALVVDRLLPALAAEAVGPWIVQALLEAARHDTAQPLVIALPPDRIEPVRACLPPGLPARLEADPTLGPTAARLSQPGRESELDLDACLAAMGEALTALLDDTARKVRHG